MTTINNLTKNEIKAIIDIRVNAYAGKLADAILNYADEKSIRCNYNRDEIIDEINESDLIHMLVALAFGMRTALRLDADLRYPLRGIDIFLELLPCEFSVLEIIGAMGLIPTIGLDTLWIEVLLA